MGAAAGASGKGRSVERTCPHSRGTRVPLGPRVSPELSDNDASKRVDLLSLSTGPPVINYTTARSHGISHDVLIPEGCAGGQRPGQEVFAFFAGRRACPRSESTLVKRSESRARRESVPNGAAAPRPLAPPTARLGSHQRASRAGTPPARWIRRLVAAWAVGVVVNRKTRCEFDRYTHLNNYTYTT